MVHTGGAPTVRAGGGAPAGAALVRLLDAVGRRLEAEQDRWFLWLPVMFGAGIAFYFALPAEPPTLAALMPAVAALALHLAGPRGGLIGLVTGAMLAAALGLAAAKMRTEWVRAPVLVGQSRNVHLSGHLELIEPRPGKGRQRLTLRVAAMERLKGGRAHARAQARPVRVRVVTRAESQTLKPGDAVHLTATLHPPPGPSLPGGYDFARAAWFKRLGAVGYADGPPRPAQGLPPPPLALRLAAAVARVRQGIGRRIVAALPGETGAIANALITGERGGISEATSQAFRDSGLSHILSISGLHMAIMAGAVFAAIRLALAAVPAIALRFPIKKWAAAGAMLGALGYLTISGMSSATVRSAIMISIMFLAVLLDRPAIALRNVALAALAILVLWPETLLMPGFQMSFAAVVALVAAYEWLHRPDPARGDPPTRGPIAGALAFLGGIIISTVVASLAVAPFGVYHFHNTQQFAILANLLAVPICNLVVMPAALAALVAMPLGLEAAPLWLMGLGINAMVWCAHAVAGLPGAAGRLPAIPTLAFALVVVGGLWCALWGTRWRLLGGVPIALGLMLTPGAERPDVLIGRGADLVAARRADGRLSALAGHGSDFELARWLEHDGDGRSPAEAARGRAFLCDRQGCIAQVQGLRLAVARTGAALRDDCRLAAILVMAFPRPARCRPAGPVIDSDAVRRHGAHALTIRDGRVEVETVAEVRGDRPWARAKERIANSE